MNKYIFFVFIFSMFFEQTRGTINYPTQIAKNKTEITNSQVELGINPKKLEQIDSIAKDGIKRKAFPGCQIVIMKNGKIVYDKQFGTITYEATQKVNPNTIYDIASLSKTTGTLLAIMKLYDEGKIKLEDKLSTYLKFLHNTNKENITIKELLFHESGLPGTLLFYQLALIKKTSMGSDFSQYVPLNSKTLQYNRELVSPTLSNEHTFQVADNIFLHKKFKEIALKKIANAPVGSKEYQYSCINFILLKEIVEELKGISLDKYLSNEFYGPMSLSHTSYLPLRSHKKENIAPTLKTDFLRNGNVQGFVHDHAAAFFGGVSGNAGLFSTAREVTKIHQMLLNNGELDGKRYLSEKTCSLFTTSTSKSQRRRLGFDRPVPTKPIINPCSKLAPNEVYGHTGYTGTCCWVDPTNKLVYVFLSNRTYPNDSENKLAKMNIRTKIQEVIYKSSK